jgi:hypothetical protein
MSEGWFSALPEADPYATLRAKAAKIARIAMCRNIKTLHNFEPPATDDEIEASALQYVRKISGSAHPSRANQAAFDCAVKKVFAASRELIDSLVTNAPPRDRGVEALKAQLRSAERLRHG